MKNRDAIPYAIPLISLAIAMAAFIMAIVVPETNVIVVLALIIALGAVVMTIFSYLISEKTRKDLLASREGAYEKGELEKSKTEALLGRAIGRSIESADRPGPPHGTHRRTGAGRRCPTG